MRLPQGTAAGQRQQRFDKARRACACERAIRLGKIHVVPCSGGYLAFRLRHNHRAEERARDDAAAAAVFPDCAACCRGCAILPSEEATTRPRSQN